MGNLARNILRVEIEVSTRCNLSCTYCPNFKFGGREGADMERPLFEKIIQGLFCEGFKGSIAYHFYNEPLLKEDLDWFISYAKKTIPDVRNIIYTNGIFLTEDRYEQLVNAGVDRFVVTKHKGVNSIPLDLYYSKHVDRNDKKIIYNEFKTINYTNRAGSIECGTKESLVNRPCLITKNSLIINHKGEVLPCYEDYQEKIKLGNLTIESLRSVLMNPKRQEMINKLAEGRRGEFETCVGCNNLTVF